MQNDVSLEQSEQSVPGAVRFQIHWQGLALRGEVRHDTHFIDSTTPHLCQVSIRQLKLKIISSNFFQLTCLPRFHNNQSLQCERKDWCV